MLEGFGFDIDVFVRGWKATSSPPRCEHGRNVAVVWINFASALHNFASASHNFASALHNFASALHNFASVLHKQNYIAFLYATVKRLLCLHESSQWGWPVVFMSHSCIQGTRAWSEPVAPSAGGGSADAEALAPYIC
jgi:hypothetical protein